jgi:hypothetical protein
MRLLGLGMFGEVRFDLLHLWARARLYGHVGGDLDRWFVSAEVVSESVEMEANSSWVDTWDSACCWCC